MKQGWILVILGIIGVVLTIFHDLLLERGYISFGQYSLISFGICAILIVVGIKKIIQARHEGSIK